MVDNEQQIAQEHSAKVPSEYVVLRHDGTAWVEVETVSARSAEAAIRTVVGDPAAKDFQAGTYVATPARSWNPVPVKAHVKATVVFGEVK